jgi:hypothetical protein
VIHGQDNLIDRNITAVIGKRLGATGATELRKGENPIPEVKVAAHSRRWC